MDFSFNVNNLLREEITLVDSRLQPCRQNGIDRHGFQQLQKMLFEIVDKMGEASAKAQGLHGTITTGRKLEMAAEHRLYIMKDENSNRGLGSILGILKMGNKKLFVYDHSKVQHELEPLCVLDFYVHESRQRMGCGRKLFDFMLRNEGIQAQHLAIDRPSPKFLSFLTKHYKLRATIPQVNNFVIFEGFFHNRTDAGNGRNRRRAAGEKSGFKINSGASPVRPSSGQRHKAVHQYESNPSHAHLGSNTRQHGDDLQFQNVLNNWMSGTARQQQHSHLGAGEMMYSRHGATPPSGYHSNGPSPSHGPQPQETMSANMYYTKLNGLASPHTCYNMGALSSVHNPYSNIVHPSQKQPAYPDTAAITTRGVSSTPNFGNRTNGAETSQVHQPSSNGTVNSPVVRDPRYLAQMNQALPATRLPDIPNNQPSGQNVARPQSGSLAHRPPSGKQNNRERREPNPPLLQRDGPPTNYKDVFNMHQGYQGRNGHLTVSPSSIPMAVPDLTPPKLAPPAYNPPAYNTPSGNWTVSGALRQQHMAAHSSNKYYSSNRIW